MRGCHKCGIMLSMIFIHITFAVLGMVCTALAYMAPSVLRLRLSYLLAGGTFTSGVYLLITRPGHLVQACIMGLVYFALVSYGIARARQKLTE